MSGTTRRNARDPNLSLDERLKILYPMVTEDETPLPKGWSGKDKGRFIGLGLLEKVSIYSTAPKKEVSKKEKNSINFRLPKKTLCLEWPIVTKLIAL